MAQIIVVTNRKGGVGKTTTVAHLGATLALMGYRVMIVDTDAQGHLGVSFGMEESAAFHALMTTENEDDLDLSEIISGVPHDAIAHPDYYKVEGELFIVRGNDRTAVISRDLPPGSGVFLFLNRMEYLAKMGNLDFIIVDTAPTLNALDTSIYMAADHFLYVTEASNLSMKGLINAIGQLAKNAPMKQQYMNRSTGIAGVVVNKIDTRTTLHRQNASNIANHPAFVDKAIVAISRRIAYEEAMNQCSTVYVYAPETGFAKEQQALAVKVLKSMGVAHAT